MAEEQIGYGVGDDSGSGIQTYHFGGNFGSTKMTKFEFTASGGKQGAPQDAIDITFDINGSEKSYRVFPVTKVYFENVIIDNSHPKFTEELKKALAVFNGKMTHIVKCFVDEAAIQAAISVPLRSFKDYAMILQNLLPKDYATKPLDIFMEWQWATTGSNTKTFLQIPQKVSNGKFVVAAVASQGGNWKEFIDENGNLSYIDGAGNKHPFERSAWFMGSKYATQQKEEGNDSSSGYQGESAQPLPAAGSGTPPAATGGGW